MKNFKWLIVGIIIGLIISASTFTLADTVKQYIGVPVAFPVYVDGEEYKPSRAFLAIEGTTYVPLVEVGNIVGADVKWNKELNRVDVIKPDKKEVSKIITVGTGEYIEFSELNALINPNGFNSESSILGVKGLTMNLYIKYKDKEVVFDPSLTINDYDNDKKYIDVAVLSQLFDESVLSQLTKYKF